MSLLEKLRAKISSTNVPVKQPEPDQNGDITMTVTAEEKEAAQQGRYQIPVAIDEYFPWKGHIFKVTSVGKMTFSAQCMGLTRNRADKLGLNR